jgi:hypothetical protein
MIFLLCDRFTASAYNSGIRQILRSFSSRAELRQLADYSGVPDSASGVAKLAVSSRYQRPRIRFSASFNYRHPSAGLVAPLTIPGGMTIC